MTAKGELASSSMKLVEKYSTQLPGEVLSLLEMIRDHRYVRASDLAGVKELAELFQVGRTTVSNWSNPERNLDFPDPVAELGGGPVYDAIESLVWWKAWTPWKGRKSGTPPIWLLNGR